MDKGASALARLADWDANPGRPCDVPVAVRTRSIVRPAWSVIRRSALKRPPPLKISTKTGRARARARDYRKRARARARASPRDQGILEILERSRL